MKRIVSYSLVCILVAGCSDSGAGGRGGPKNVAEDASYSTPEDGSKVVGSAKDIDVGTGAPSLALFVTGQGLFTDTIIDLPAITPGTGVEKRFTVKLANFGMGLLSIQSVGFAATNGDGKPKNVYLKLVSKEINLGTDLPVHLNPHSLDISSYLEFEVVYAPQKFDGNHGTLAIETNDPNRAVRNIVFKSQPLDSEIRVVPGDAFFWFATPLEFEDGTFEVHNDGIAPLLVQKITLETASPAFSLVEGSDTNGIVDPAGKLGYKPLKFTVRYAPEFGQSGGSGVIKIESTDPDGTLTIPLEGKYKSKPGESPCLWKSDGGPLDNLDFSDVFAGSGIRTLTMHNVGTPVCTLAAVSFPGDVQGNRYAWSASIPATEPDGPASPVTELPVSITLGQELTLDIKYTAGEMALDSDVVIEFQDPDKKTLTLKGKGGGPVPCFELAPGPTESPEMLQFVAQTGQGAQRNLVVYNCGDGALTVLGVSIKDDTSGDDPSALWVITSPTAGEKKIPVGELQIYQLLMAAQTEDKEVKGKAVLEWLDITGAKQVEIALEALVGANYVVPIANPGTTESYAGAVVGKPVLLDGSGSTSDGDAIDPNGYSWSLVARPGQSKLITSSGAGPAQLTVVPDVPGNYLFSLAVKTSGNPALHSTEQTVMVVVEESQEAP